MSTLDQLTEFIDSVEPLILEPLKIRCEELSDLLAPFSEWYTTVDILRVAQVTDSEDPYTELLAWLLSAEAHPETALIRQRAWLNHLGIDAPTDATGPGQLRTQVHTRDGIPDLVISWPRLVVVVEAKTISEEHDTPVSKLPQTVSYPDSIRALYGLRPSCEVKVVFLTKDGAKAANEGAILTTWIESALAIAHAIHPDSLPPDTASSFQIVLTHFLSQSFDLNQRCFLKQILRNDEIKGQTLLENLTCVNTLFRLVVKDIE